MLRPTTKVVARSSHNTNAVVLSNKFNSSNKDGFKSTWNAQSRPLSTQKNVTDIKMEPVGTWKPIEASGLGLGGLAGLALLGAFFWSSSDDKEKDKKKAEKKVSEDNKSTKAETKIVDGLKFTPSMEQHSANWGEDKPNVVFVLGGAGSHKNKYIREVAKEHDWIILSTEDLINGEIEDGSEMGRMFKERIRKGERLPAQEVIKLVQEAMFKEPSHKKFIVSDFPRSEEDARVWDQMMNSKTNLRMVFYLEHPSAGGYDRSSDLDKPYTRGGTPGTNLSYAEQALFLNKRYGDLGFATRVDVTRPDSEVFAKLNDVFGYIDHEQRNRTELGAADNKQIMARGHEYQPVSSRS